MVILPHEMNECPDPFLVTSRLGMTSVFKALISHRTLVHMRLELHGPAIITTVLDIDPGQGRITVDADDDDRFNQRLAGANVIHLEHWSSGPHA